MMLQIGDEGVVSSVDEENLIYVDKNELEQFIESYQELEKENEQLKLQLQSASDQRDEFFRGARENANRVGKLKKENEQLKQQNSRLMMEVAEYSRKVKELEKGDVE